VIPSDRARARDGRLAGLWILAPQGLRASPTRSIFVTLTFRVLTPMISTRHGRVQAPLVDRAGRRATATPGYRPVRPIDAAASGHHGGRTGAVHDGPAAPEAPSRAPRQRTGAPDGDAVQERRVVTGPYGRPTTRVRAPRGCAEAVRHDHRPSPAAPSWRHAERYGRLRATWTEPAPHTTDRPITPPSRPRACRRARTP
jgi:hypothetical protein